jgi:ATP-dependent Clp protease ATP-binding subunit ClpC
MFERYDENARRSLFFARYEASQFGSVKIEPEPLLLGLLRLKQNPASRFLDGLPDLGRGLAESLGRNTPISTSVEIPFAKPTRRALQVAAEEASRLGHTHVGPEHLLLALLADTATVAGDLLSRNGLQLDAVRKDIAQGTAVGRPGAMLFPGNESLGSGRRAALQQMDMAVTFIRSLGDECQTDEGRRLIDQICRDIEALKFHLPESN